jgi:hypothetical protein
MCWLLHSDATRSLLLQFLQQCAHCGSQQRLLRCNFHYKTRLNTSDLLLLVLLLLLLLAGMPGVS